MRRGPRRDDGAIDLARERRHRIEALQFQRRDDVRRDRVIRLDETDDIRLRHFREDARVQTPEVAGVDYADYRDEGRGTRGIVRRGLRDERSIPRPSSLVPSPCLTHRMMP